MTYSSVDHIRAANEEAGQTWFGPAEMRFFGCRLLNGVIDGRFFITSERPPGSARRYSIRMADEDGYIRTIGRFMGYATAAQARAAAHRLTAARAEYERAGECHV